MRYFLMKQDKKNIHVPKLVNWFPKLNTKFIRTGFYDRIPKRMLLNIEPDKRVIFTDVIEKPVFLVSGGMKECMNLYESNTQWKEIVLLDGKNSQCGEYYLPVFREIDCLTERTRYNLDHSRADYIELDENKIDDRAFFRLAGLKECYTVVRLDFLESILKREASGFVVEELDVKEKVIDE